MLEKQNTSINVRKCLLCNKNGMHPKICWKYGKGNQK